MNIITDTAELICNQGTASSKLTVTSQDFTTIEDKPIATEADKQPNINIKPFGQCKLKPSSGGYLPCMPAPTQWEQVAENDTINDMKILTEGSTCRCAIGGTISVKNKGHNEQHEIDDKIIINGNQRNTSPSEVASSGEEQSQTVTIRGGIVGVSKISALRVLNEIQNSFYKYNEIKRIFELESNKLKIKPISRVDLDKAIRGKNTDVRCLAYAYFLAINSAKTHYVDMTFSYETLNNLSINALGVASNTKGSYIDNHYGGGVNIGYQGGSFSIIVLDSKVDIGDFTYARNGVNYPRLSTPVELLAHELLGHGYGRVIESTHFQHNDAIQMSNLYWRARGYFNFYRNGIYHGTGILLNKTVANQIPSHFRL